MLRPARVNVTVGLWNRKGSFGKLVSMKPASPLNKTGTNVRQSKPEAIVQCEGYRCMAVRDKEGHWIDLHGKPLKVLKVVVRF